MTQEQIEIALQLDDFLQEIISRIVYYRVFLEVLSND